MNLGDLPCEIIGLVVKFLDLESKINFGLASRLFLDEVKRETKPKCDKIVVLMNGTCTRKIWLTFDFLTGNYFEELYRIYDADGNVIEQEWKNRKGERHKENKPACISKKDGYYEKIWLLNGNRHRNNGPAYECSSLRLNVYGHYERVEKWYQNNMLHRDDGPALTWNEGLIITKRYYQKDVEHTYKINYIS